MTQFLITDTRWRLSETVFRTSDLRQSTWPSLVLEKRRKYTYIWAAEGVVKHYSINQPRTFFLHLQHVSSSYGRALRIRNPWTERSNPRKCREKWILQLLRQIFKVALCFPNCLLHTSHDSKLEPSICWANTVLLYHCCNVSDILQIHQSMYPGTSVTKSEQDVF